MLWLKTCARCKGDLYEDHDDYGRFISCLQCGHELNNREVTLLWTAIQGKMGETSNEKIAGLVAFMQEVASTPPPPPVDEALPRPRRRRRTLIRAHSG